MAIEVEIKLKIEDSGELIKKLKDQHFTVGKTVWESDLYFTSEHRNMKACDEALRVRCVKETGHLFYDAKRSGIGDF